MFDKNLENVENEADVYGSLEEDIRNSDLEEDEKTRRISHIHKIKKQNVNILLVGSTGVGKSSTINALFNMEVAKVGMDVNPETENIRKYELANMTIWDTPGLGDNVDKDADTIRQLIEKLDETDDDGKLLIDLVVLIADASSKDLGMLYKVINDVLIPCLDEDAQNRVVIGLNQADIAMKGKHWDDEKNEPDETLKDFLRRKADSVRERINEATGLDIRPICYCAGYMENEDDMRKPYNLSKLLFYIISQIPAEKRISVAFNINPNEDNWLHDDEEEDYAEAVQDSIWESVKRYSWMGKVCGKDVGGSILGVPGKIIGGAIGGLAGALRGFIIGLF